ncbi:isoleucine--tRNA ligase [candidate division GN15 bacterium]|nr:isoleucine--tRNA ligase [candidate division GN15 bacterium]
MKFDTLKDNFSLPKAEEQILRFWTDEQVFAKVRDMASDRPFYVFFEGPPTANGRPGIHHVISRTIKDLVCRYQTMKGYRVDRKAGWDTHGLPVEIEAEKQLGLESKPEIINYGVAKFNQKCRESVFKYLDDWNKITNRIGYWLDLDNAYITLKNEYIETVWWILKNFFDRGLIYRGYKTVPFCPRCETGLSSHEVAQGYTVVKDPSIYVKVKAADGDFSYLVWTTTPWTLPSNAALCMKPDADYVMVEHEGEKLVLAEALMGQIFEEPPKVVQKFKGKDFLKRKYIPLFDFYAHDHDQSAFFVINADFVTMEDGTGIVHIAPGFGADDYEVGQQFGLPILQAIEGNGIFKDIAGKYAGKWIKDADPIITEDLKAEGKLFKKARYEHNYPFCWRCSSPLIYITRQSWYLKTTQFKEQLLKNNNDINWYPDDIRTGRMANWLENNVDWSLSRERFWGTPLPFWLCEKCGAARAVGSIEQLRKEGIDVPGEIDLHKPMMDQLKLRCECGGEMSRVLEVLDVWFDSGAMPYAQWHYPFENEKEFEQQYPANFISEAVDQTRGWFYSLLAISTLLFDKAPFKNVIVLEMIQDAKGKKMSKSKGNVVDPFETVDTYGADPTRWYLVSTSNPWLPTRFDLKGLEEVVRKYFDTLRNTYSFFALYANIDTVLERADADGQSVREWLKAKAGEPTTFDRWIISRYNSLIGQVSASFDGYDITRAVRLMQDFVIEELSNWYVRNNRRRFWAEGDDPDKMRAYFTLYEVLLGVAKLMAPVAPFSSELLYRELTGENRTRRDLPLSVHMAEYPKLDQNVIDSDLERIMGLVEKAVSLGRAARSRKNLKVRQPLSRLMISVPRDVSMAQIEPYLPIIKAELNVKEVAAADDLDQYITYSAKLNFQVAGKKLGGLVKSIAKELSAMSSERVAEFARSGELAVEADGTSVTLESEDVEIIRHDQEGYAVETEANLTVALVTELTEDLVREGIAREMINKIQNMRKGNGYEVTDRIQVYYQTPDEKAKQAAEDFRQRICSETLADQLVESSDVDGKEGSKEWSLNGIPATLFIERVTN